MASQWGILVVLAKVGSPKLVGEFAYALAVVSPAILFANIQLRAILATDTRSDFPFGDYFVLRLVTTSLAVVGIAAIALLAGQQDDLTLIVILFAIAKSFEAISDIIYGLLQQHERMDRVAQAMLIKGPASLVALGAAVYLTGRLTWGITALAVVWLALLLLVDVPNAQRLHRLNFSGGDSKSLFVLSTSGFRGLATRLWPLVRTAAPMGVVTLLASLNTNIPRYFIEHEFGVAELGVFAAISYLIIAGNAVVQALGQTIAPRLSHYFAVRNIRAFRTLLLKGIAVGVALGGVGLAISLLAGREILTFIYSPYYGKQVELFNWIMLIALVTYVAGFLGIAVTAMREFKVQVPVHAGKVTITTTLCVLLLGDHGLKGAAWALLGAMSFSVAAYGAIVVHRIRRDSTLPAAIRASI